MASYRDLLVWQKSYRVTLEIYSVTASFPKDEIFGLVSQMRRSAVSIPSNIAEGNHRGSRKEHIQFFRIAFGSACELETQLSLSKDLGYISDAKSKEILLSLSEVIKMLSAMIQKLSQK